LAEESLAAILWVFRTKYASDEAANLPATMFARDEQLFALSGKLNRMYVIKYS
jgi:hypothetical protein